MPGVPTSVDPAVCNAPGRWQVGDVGRVLSSWPSLGPASGSEEQVERLRLSLRVSLSSCLSRLCRSAFQVCENNKYTLEKLLRTSGAGGPAVRGGSGGPLLYYL